MLGKLLYKIYYGPKNRAIELQQQSEPGYIAAETGKAEMKIAATKLKEQYHADTPVFDLHFLTGRNFWYQTIFCLYSLQKVCSDVSFNGILYDDNSLTTDDKNHIACNFPHCTVVSGDQLGDNIDQYLPKNKFPHIRRTREFYPHLKKLTDIHAGQTGWKMVLDSDMLFFNYPSAIVNWLKEPKEPVCLQDVMESYGYPLEFLEKIAGKELPKLINVGLTGIRSESIDWEKIEYWIRRLSKYKSSYYLEQALTAMLFSAMPAEILDPLNYVILPAKEMVQKRSGVLHHYVADSKETYFTTAWKQVL